MIAARKREFEPAPSVEGRKVMSIEQALVWAYQQELAVFGVAGISPLPSNWSVERVDGGSGSAAWDEAVLAQNVAPDALAIEKRVQEIEQGKWLDVDMDLTGLLASTYVSLSEPAFFADALPRAANLVVVNAKLGTMPDLSGAPTPHAMRSANGEVIVRRMAEFKQKTVDEREITFSAEQPVRAGINYAPTRGKPTRGRYPQGSYCLVGYAPDWAEVMRERAEYVVWWLALKWLSENLDHLERIRVTGPELPMRPWHALDASGSLDIASNR